MLQQALTDGLILSVLLSALVVVTLRWNAESWLGDYPPDIREAFGPMSAEARRVKLVGGIAFLVFIAAVLVRGLVELSRASGGELTFLDAFVYTFIVGQVFNLIDLLVLDWLWFVTLSPAFIILPGTEGMAGYKDYGFHFRAFLVGLAGGTVFSAVVAAIAVGLSRVF
jgi:hypothetical protein